MNIKSIVDEVVGIIREGGMEVITPVTQNGVSIVSPSPPSQAYLGKSYNQQGIRTFIQLDSDYVTMLTPSALRTSRLLEQHIKAVHEKLSMLQTVLFLVNQSAYLPILLLTGGFYIGNVTEEWYVLPISLAATLMKFKEWREWLVHKLVWPLLRYIGTIYWRLFLKTAI